MIFSPTPLYWFTTKHIGANNLIWKKKIKTGQASLDVLFSVYLDVSLSGCLSVWMSVSLDLLIMYVCLNVILDKSVFMSVFWRYWCLSGWLNVSVWLDVSCYLGVWISIFLDFWMYECLSGCRYGYLDVSMSACLQVCTSGGFSVCLSWSLNVCMCVCMYVLMSVLISLKVSECLSKHNSVCVRLDICLDV